MNPSPLRTRIRKVALVSLLLAALLSPTGNWSRPSRTLRPRPSPLRVGTETRIEKPQLGRIRTRFADVETESESICQLEGDGPAAQTSDVEQFFARHVDPWFRRSSGWQIYNPDRLDPKLESARTTSLAFAAGLRYRHSF